MFPQVPALFFQRYKTSRGAATLLAPFSLFFFRRSYSRDQFYSTYPLLCFPKKTQDSTQDEDRKWVVLSTKFGRGRLRPSLVFASSRPVDDCAPSCLISCWWAGRLHNLTGFLFLSLPFSSLLPPPPPPPPLVLFFPALHHLQTTIYNHHTLSSLLHLAYYPISVYLVFFALRKKKTSQTVASVCLVCLLMSQR